MRRKHKIYKKNINLFHRFFYFIAFSFIFISNSAGTVCAANIYIDPTFKGTELGTFENPYNSWKDFSIKTGNDYRQRCGTTYYGTLSIKNSGIRGNTIIIGAYYDDNGIGHEDTSPSFGEKCGNNDNKPIITDSDQTGSAIDIDASYIELNSIQVKKGQTTIYIDGDHNYIQYCRVMGGIGGARFGLIARSDYNYVGYNYFRGYDSNPRINDLDGIQFANTDNSTIEYNIVDGYAHSGIATTGASCDNNEIRYNAVYSYDDNMDQFATINGNGNKFHHNYCFDCGTIALYRSVGNYIYYNIIDGLISNPYVTGGSIITLQTLVKGKNVSDNKIFNNIIYDRRDGAANPKGIMLYDWKADGGVIERNEIFNNIFLNFGTTSAVIHILDHNNKVESNPSDPDVNIFRNNLVYGWNGKYVAYVEGKYYKYITDQAPPASYFNSYGAAFENMDSDPGLEDPVNHKFWPDSSTDAVIGNGYKYKLGESYDDLLDPDPANTNFIASPPLVKTVNHNNEWCIGAYALKRQGKPGDPSPEAVSRFRIIPKK